MGYLRHDSHELDATVRFAMKIQLDFADTEECIRLHIAARHLIRFSKRTVACRARYCGCNML